MWTNLITQTIVQWITMIIIFYLLTKLLNKYGKYFSTPKSPQKLVSEYSLKLNQWKLAHNNLSVNRAL